MCVSCTSVRCERASVHVGLKTGRVCNLLRFAAWLCAAIDAERTRKMKRKIKTGKRIHTHTPTQTAYAAPAPLAKLVIWLGCCRICTDSSKSVASDIRMSLHERVSATRRLCVRKAPNSEKCVVNGERNRECAFACYRRCCTIIELLLIINSKNWSCVGRVWLSLPTYFTFWRKQLQPTTYYVLSRSHTYTNPHARAAWRSCHCDIKTEAFRFVPFGTFSCFFFSFSSLIALSHVFVFHLHCSDELRRIK